MNKTKKGKVMVSQTKGQIVNNNIFFLNILIPSAAIIMVTVKWMVVGGVRIKKKRGGIHTYL